MHKIGVVWLCVSGIAGSGCHSSSQATARSTLAYQQLTCSCANGGHCTVLRNPTPADLPRPSGYLYSWMLDDAGDLFFLMCPAGAGNIHLAKTRPERT